MPAAVPPFAPTRSWRTVGAGCLRPALVALALTLPWLNPFAPGPTPAVMPYLFSWACMIGAVLFWPTKGADKRTLIATVALSWVAAAALSAGIGLLQYFGHSAWAGVWLNHTEAGQAFGNLRQRNQFATLMAIGLAALLWCAASLEHRRAHVGASRAALQIQLLLLLTTALLSLGNAASSSRTGLLQLGVIAVLAWHWQRNGQSLRQTAQRRPAAWPLVHQVLFVALASYLVAMITLPLLAGLDPMAHNAWSRLRAGDAPCSSRATLWRNVLYLVAQRPWLGWGWGELDYAHFITLYPGTRFCDILDNAHNLPLHLAVELGVPVSLVLCALALALTWRAHPWSERSASRQLGWTVLAVIGFHSLLEYPLWYGPFQMASVLCLWLLWPLSWRLERIRIYMKNGALALVFKALIAIFCIVFLGHIGWSYWRVSQIYLSPPERLAAYRDNTLEKIRDVAWFQDPMRFAELTTMELSASNAAQVHALALEMLHFSPEVQVIERVLDSAVLLGKSDAVAYFSARYQAAFPADYARWAAQTSAIEMKEPLQ